MPAYFAPNGLADGWAACRDALANTRALCRDYLTPEEAKDIHTAINMIDRMLTNR
jgi:hypothetical protein